MIRLTALEMFGVSSMFHRQQLTINIITDMAGDTNISTGSNGYVWGSESQLGSDSGHEIDLTYSLAQGSNFADNSRWTGYTCPHCGKKDV